MFGIATESFIDKEREELSLGAVELKGHDSTYQADDEVQHTPQRVLALLRDLDSESEGMLTAFFDMMLFDAWVGILDRHPENWGVIRGGEAGMRLAPIYDTASCLAVALADGHRLLNRPSDDEIRKYAENCPSGFGDGRQLVTLKNVTNFMLSQDKCRRRLGTQVASFRVVMENVPLFLQGVPDGLLSEARKTLAARLLAIRLDLLEGCAS